MASWDAVFEKTKKEYDPNWYFDYFNSLAQTWSTFFERKPKAAQKVQAERTAAQAAPAGPVRFENVREDFAKAAHADGTFLGEGSTRRGKKRSAEDEAERTEENIEMQKQRIMTETDPYKVLGLPESATLIEMNRRFKRLALLFHPDKNKAEDAEDASAVFRKIYESRKELVKRMEGRGGASAGAGGASTASAGAGGASTASPPAGLNLDVSYQNNETYEAYLVRMYRVEEYYVRMIKESDVTIRQLDADLTSMQGDEPEVRTARDEINRIKAEVQAERAKLGEKIMPIRIAITGASRSLRQSENAARMTKGISTITESEWTDLFKRKHGLIPEMSRFGKRRRPPALYAFFGRYIKRHPRTHPSRIVRKFMRAMAMSI